MCYVINGEKKQMQIHTWPKTDKQTLITNKKYIKLNKNVNDIMSCMSHQTCIKLNTIILKCTI